jgi:hypothetical protein
MVVQDVPIGTTYGSGPPRGRRRVAPLVWIVAAICVAFWAMAAICVAVDPYDVFPWGLQPRLAATNYPPDKVPFLIDVVAKDPAIDMVLVGGSTAVDFTPQMLERFPGVKNPFNLSYEGSLPFDREVVTQELLKYSHARRVMLSFDYNYATEMHQARAEFPFYLYDGKLLDNIRMIGPSTFQVALSALLHHGLLSNNGNAAFEKLHASKFQAFQTAATMRDLARKVARVRKDIDQPSPRGCADFPAIGEQLAPYAKALSQRHVALDIFIPPYAQIAPYDWKTIVWRGELRDAILNDQITIRRCLVQAVGALPGVRVFGFDNDDWITGDLANYRDTAHTQNTKVQDYMIASMAQGTHRLTTANVDAYLAAMHRRVVAAKVFNSKVSFSP